MLEALGGDVDIDASVAGRFIRGSGCPLSLVVQQKPQACMAVESLISEIVGTPVRSCCEHGARPRCCFAVDEGNAA
jgi:hypothetical protein